MKCICKLFVAAAFLFPVDLSAAATQIDPFLFSAIVAQSQMLKEQYEERSKNHNLIQVAQAGITLALDRIHTVESKVLEYMSNASEVVRNMYQLKQIVELVAVDIPDNLVGLSKDIPNNIKGTAITLFVNKTYSDVTADILALSDIVTNLVTSSYSFKDDKESDKHVNLLSAAERYSILQSVYARLDNINWTLRLTRYYIKTFGWQELWRGIDRESWCKVMYSKVLANQLIQRWNSL